MAKMTDAELLAEIEAVQVPPARRGPALLAAHSRAAPAQIVEIPGVGEVEFPGNMSDAEITAAARKLTADAGRGANPWDEFKPAAQGDTREPQGMPESGIRGALQGATFGFGDEAAAAVESVLPSFLRNDVSRKAVGDGATVAERYRNARDYYRGRNAAAEESNPGTYLAGQVTGAVAAPGGAARGLGRALAGGATMGAGYSEADVTKGDVGGLVSDAAVGAGFGAAGHGAGKLLRGGLGRLTRSGAQQEALATAKAGAQAAEETAGKLQSAAGALGGETQKGSRYVENLMRLEQTMTPQQRALYQQLQAQGVVPNLQQSVAQGTLDALPAQAATIAAKRAELAVLQQAAPAATAARAQDLLRPQVKADAKSFAKSYAEPLAWALGAQQIGNAVGLDPAQQGILAGAAGIVGGRTRAGKALATRLNRPGHQAAIGRAKQAAAQGQAAQLLEAILRRGAPSAATDAAAREAEAEAELARLLAK